MEYSRLLFFFYLLQDPRYFIQYKIISAEVLENDLVYVFIQYFQPERILFWIKDLEKNCSLFRLTQKFLNRSSINKIVN